MDHDLPLEMLELILRHAIHTLQEARTVASVCRQWRHVLADSEFIRHSFYQQNPPLFVLFPPDNALLAFDPLAWKWVSVSRIHGFPDSHPHNLRLSQGILYYHNLHDNSLVFILLASDISNSSASFTWVKTPRMLRMKLKPTVFFHRKLGKIVVMEGQWPGNSGGALEVFDMKKGVWEETCPEEEEWREWMKRPNSAVECDDRFYFCSHSVGSCCYLDLSAMKWGAQPKHVSKDSTIPQYFYSSVDEEEEVCVVDAGNEKGLVFAGISCRSARLMQLQCGNTEGPFLTEIARMPWDVFKTFLVRYPFNVRVKGIGGLVYFYREDGQSLCVYEIAQRRWRTLPPFGENMDAYGNDNALWVARELVC